MISGSGTNLQAIIDRIEAGNLDAEINLVVSNKPEAYGLTRAQRHGIRTAVVDYRNYSKRSLPHIAQKALPQEFNEAVKQQHIYADLPDEEIRDRLARVVLAEQEIIRILELQHHDLICLAGFMRLLSPYFIGHYNTVDRYGIVNIHPALLPAFPGTDGYKDTFAYGCRFGGITVHFVDEGEDTGPIIAQAVYPIWLQDTLEAIRQRGLELEHILLPQCIQWIAEGSIQIEKGTDGRPEVHIVDPRYPQFLEQLMKQAFGREGWEI
jgi:phosphoribosylglycinamide formyltransferase-1